MGLLDFAVNMGRKLFSDDDEAAEKIKEHIEAENPGMKDVQVTFKDGVVELGGSSDNAEAVEKAVLMAGNVKGVGEVKIDNVAAPAPAENVEYYVIQSGDTLSKLAQKYYGKAMDYPRIFEANREVIKDPDLIFVGQKIRIPLD